MGRPLGGEEAGVPSDTPMGCMPQLASSSSREFVALLPTAVGDKVAGAVAEDRALLGSKLMIHGASRLRALRDGKTVGCRGTPQYGALKKVSSLVERKELERLAFDHTRTQVAKSFE